MRYYARFNAQGFPDGFDVGTAAPQGFVEITQAQYADLVRNQGSRRRVDGIIQPYAPPAGPERVPDEIEFGQMIIGAMLEGWITPSEAEEWSKRGGLPALVDATVAQLPAQQQAIARIRARTLDKVKRSDHLIAAAAQIHMPDATPEQRAAEGDRLFRAWAKL